MNPDYTGRFAPSPTGPIHFGTLIAAVASYLRARSQGGQWLLRIEDVDVLREVEGAAEAIISTLARLGFEWDGDIVYQTARTDAYQQALQTLQQKDLVFPCTCSRKLLAAQTGEWSPVYPGTCRQRRDWSGDDYAIRLTVDDVDIAFDDGIFGAQQEQLAQQTGDFVIKRRDGLFAYQLAVVVDDAWQGVTEVVRGTDLMPSTARQIYLQRCLGVGTPAYLHFPVAVDSENRKLSKSTATTAVDLGQPIATLNRVLHFLHQPRVESDTLPDFWREAIANWRVENIPAVSSIPV